MIIGDWLTLNRKELPEGESLLILAFALKREKPFLLAHPEYILSPEEERLLDHCTERRKKHEPLAYITGEKEFFGLPFFVTPATLIPRPETEILVECVLEKIANDELRTTKSKTEKISLIDIGTGSGCIPISIMSMIREKNPGILPYIRCLAIDISPAALAIAEKNAKRHEMHTLISFQKSDLLSDTPDIYFQTSSLILTANLPYLSQELYQGSPEDVRLYEPKNALEGDSDDGTTLIINLLKQYIRKSHSLHSFLILEISPEQGASLLKQGRKLFPQSKASLLPDLSGRDRFLIIQTD